MRTCVQPTGVFRVGIHRPRYDVMNLREEEALFPLGTFEDGSVHNNSANFPAGDISETHARPIYEIANPFFFRGSTFIDSGWAEDRVKDPHAIAIPPQPHCSLQEALAGVVDTQDIDRILVSLPRPLLYDFAANATDPDELVVLAQKCCRMEFDQRGNPTGLCYVQQKTGVRADIDDFELFETLANNPYLPDIYKEVMVLRPGVQGGSEIVGDWQQGKTHVFEYLRRNSYIPWGHFAANMAHDAVRYRTSELSIEDMHGLRHLYYQRMVVTMAAKLDIPVKGSKRRFSENELEEIRLQVIEKIKNYPGHPATLWGWNFGYDFSGSGYRLHASHQMIHQQFAMVPEHVELLDGSSTMSYSCGDQVAEVVDQYKNEYDSDFFDDYIRCIRNNQRVDGRDDAYGHDLVVFTDANIMLFVPKAQVSQWELQLMVIADQHDGPVGNVLEADTGVRKSVDSGILVAQRIYAALGAKMVTSIEFSKRLGLNTSQRLLYSFLPKLPWSMGAFSEAQQRYICGHFPEDFAVACRANIPDFL